MCVLKDELRLHGPSAASMRDRGGSKTYSFRRGLTIPIAGLLQEQQTEYHTSEPCRYRQIARDLRRRAGHASTLVHTLDRKEGNVGSEEDKGL